MDPQVFAAPAIGATSPSWGDIDNDGLLDLTIGAFYQVPQADDLTVGAFANLGDRIRAAETTETIRLPGPALGSPRKFFRVIRSHEGR